jgi:membrane-associated phospholipid phosphatase
MTRAFKSWLIGLIVTSIFVTVSVQWFDRPVAQFFYDFGQRQRAPVEIADRAFSIPGLAAVAFAMCGLAALMGRRQSKTELAIALCSISVLATTVIKNQLKLIFGRTWPYLLSENAYGFNFFKEGKSFESFPSGHAAVAAVVLYIMWTVFPTKRAFFVLCAVALDMGLIVFDVHFLSDVLAGSFVGISIGLFTMTMWKATISASDGGMPI